MPLVLGRYELQRRLAVGGMGEVFLAVQRGLPGVERHVIVKTLLPDLARDRESAEQFLDEARVIASLNHPNVVSLLEVGVWEGTPFIVMELIRGKTVSQVRRLAEDQGVAIDPWASAAIIRDAALGLHHAHVARDGAGQPLSIVHRDVSPQNLMVRDDGLTKVLDFGIAWAAHRSARTATGLVKGKLVYMAPEQLEGRSVDHRVDQFALGVVFWELLSGRRLFQGDSEAAVARQILQEPVPLPGGSAGRAPPGLESLVVRMLQRDPAARFADCAAVAETLESEIGARGGTSAGHAGVVRALESLGATQDEAPALASTIDASPELLWPRTAARSLSAEGATETSESPGRGKRIRRRRRAQAGAALVGLALAIAGGVQLVRRHDERNAAVGRLQTMLEQNAWLADRSIDRFCSLNREIAPLWPRQSFDGGANAAEVLDHILRWEGDHGPLSPDPIALPRIPSVPNDAGPEITWLQMVEPSALQGFDLTWLSELRRFDHWWLDAPPDILAASRPPRWTWKAKTTLWSPPIPYMIPLQSVAKVRLYQGLTTGDLTGALADVDRLRDLSRTTNTLLGEAIGLALFRMESVALAAARDRKQAVPPHPSLDFAGAAKTRGVLFAGPAFFLPGVSERVMRRASECSVSPCSAMGEASRYHSAMGQLLGAAHTDELLSLARQTPGCDEPLIRLGAEPQDVDLTAAIGALSGLNGSVGSSDGSIDLGAIPAGRLLDMQ